MKKNSVSKSLGIEAPWKILEDAYDDTAKQRTVTVTCTDTSSLECPKCGKASPFYDLRSARQWRHLDTCNYQTALRAQVPRVKCSECGVKTARVPWAGPSSRYTYEESVIGWIKEASILAISRQMGLGWKAIAGIVHRAVQRGLARKKEQVVANICVDEVAYKKGHKYFTVVSDADTATVLYVGIGRDQKVLMRWFQQLSTEQLNGIRSMDMWPAYISATLACLPDAKKKICFDRFHVAKHLGVSVDKVQHKALLKEGNPILTGTKYSWLKSPHNMSLAQKRAFHAIRTSSLKTSKAWAKRSEKCGTIKAQLGPWNKTLSWAMRCRLEPVKDVARMIRKHLWGIINAIVLDASNGPAESINSRIKTVKIRAHGFRNKERFVDAIYFHLGGLDLSPRYAKS